MCSTITCREPFMMGDLEGLKWIYACGGLWHQDYIYEFLQIEYACCWHREYYGRTRLPNIDCFYFAVDYGCPFNLDYLQSSHARHAVTRHGGIETYNKCMAYLSRKYLVAIKKIFGGVIEGPALLVHSFIFHCPPLLSLGQTASFR